MRDVPEYRNVLGTIELTLQVYEHKQIEELPASRLEEPFNEKFKYVQVGQSISVLEQMAIDRNKSDKPDPFFYRPFPMELLYLLQPAARRLYPSTPPVNVIKAIIKGNAYKLTEILSSVRHKLLSFVMEVSDKFGFNIEIAKFKKNQKQNNQTINYYMKTEITNTGDGNVVNTGDNSVVTANVTISKQDLAKLKELGVEEAKINELSEIVEVHGEDKEKLKPKILKWFGEVSAHLTAISLGHNIPQITDFISKLF